MRIEYLTSGASVTRKSGGQSITAAGAAAVITPVCGKACQALNDQNRQCSKRCTKAANHDGICSCGGPHT
jgi:hypothetical protein